MEARFDKVLFVMALAATVLGTAPARADHLPEVKVITADQLKAWLDEGKKMRVIDSRVAAEYKEAHIPGAINIPAPVMDQYADRLPKDRSLPLVFYCNGWPECKKSHEGSAKAVEWGYKQVYWFRGGIPVWQSHGYPLE